MKMEEIQGIFFQECEEGLAQAEAGLMALQAGTQDDETVNTVFRAVHSIKGGSGAFGFAALQHYTHRFETLLDQVRSGERAPVPLLVETLLAAFDMLADHVAAIRGERATPDDVAMLARLEAACAGDAVAEDAAPAVDDSFGGLGFDLDALIGALDTGEAAIDPDWEERPDAPAATDDASQRLHVRPLRGALAHGGEPLLLIRELAELGGTVEAVDWSTVPPLDGYDPAEAYLAWTIAMPADVARADIEEIFEFVAEDCELRFGDEAPAETAETAEAFSLDDFAFPEAAPEPAAAIVPLPVPAAEKPTATAAASAPAATPAPIGPTIRVDLEKLDRLVNLVGELVINQSMLAQRLRNCGIAQIDELSDFEQLTRELQDSAMAIRAQSINSVFSRVPRIVRELQASTGKAIALDIEGEHTELDKTVIERIGEPLTHLIRNAIDHGLEGPEERIAAGKPAEGRIRLSAEHRSGRILVSVSDDGRGIDRARVRAKAAERGLIAADARLSDEDIDNLIFAPGFSTAESVSEISGRGVGMDVVRQNVQALGGRIAIASEPGRGSTFTLSLPLTLAIAEGLTVSVGAETYIVPTAHVVETIQAEPNQLRRMGLGQAMMNVRGEWLTVHGIGDMLGVAGAERDPAKAVMLLVDSEISGRGLLMVDMILDQRQVVIKSLETHYGAIDGVAGATILGDGRVALILDAEAILSAQRAPLPHRASA